MKSVTDAVFSCTIAATTSCVHINGDHALIIVRWFLFMSPRTISTMPAICLMEQSRKVWTPSRSTACA